MAIAASSAGFVPDRPDLGHRAGGIDLADAAFFAIGPDAGAPRGLPLAAYRALAFAELEDDAVWTRSWLAIGFGSEIPAPGDLLPFTAGHHGIHVQREQDGGLTGRFNKAQHGGCRAVPLQCRTGTKTGCSFTACGHSRDGLPLPAGADGPTPAMHQYLGLRPERLLPVQTYACGPLVMIHLDPAAARPDGLADGLGACTGAARRVEVGANWKLAAQALAQAPAQARVRGEGGASLHLSGALFSGESAQIRLHFPNLVLITAGSETLAVMLQPTALGRTLLRIGLLGESAPEASLAAWLAEIAARTRAAEAAQAALSGAPDGEARPEANEAGLWLQARIAEAVRARPRHETIQPLYATAQGRGC